ncbi:hypothetical protein RhiJN_09323 [Ceratobasidium sp. AG-Ba]|nr:hypothetical protein RhiJN_09323 [Ceratobasidium sp. AG-Ba]
MSKRKHDETADDPTPTPLLRIQAYEADLVHDRPNLAELVQLEKRGGTGPGGLIRWGEQDDDDVWVDRFDARLLLAPSDLAPGSLSPTHDDPLKDIGWSDLPSDAEDTFFMTPIQIAEYRHTMMRNEMEQGRPDNTRRDEEEKWGGSDEEPDDAQLELMTRTAVHILASPNPVQLEMRILANHGRNPKFAFLRGRWSRAWARVKSGGVHNEKKVSGDDGGKKTSGIGGLAGEDEQERVKAERRARAQEWMRRKRQERELGPSA